MGYKILSTVDVSEISAFTGLSNVLEAKVARFDDVIIVLRMEDEDMVSVRCLNRVAEFFGVSQEDVILDRCGITLDISVMGQSMFKYEEDDVFDELLDSDESWDASQALSSFRKDKELSELIGSVVFDSGNKAYVNHLIEKLENSTGCCNQPVKCPGCPSRKK